MKFNSIKFKISVLYTVILALILFVFSGLLYFISNKLTYEVDTELNLKARAVASTIDDYMALLKDKPGALKTAAVTTIAMNRQLLFGRNLNSGFQRWWEQVKRSSVIQYYITFIGRNDSVDVHSDNMSNNLLKIFLEDLHFPKNRILFQTITYHKTKIRVINYPYSGSLGGRYIIQVGIAENSVLRLLSKWFYSIALAIPLVLILTGFMGRLLASRILNPMNKITKLAKNITHHDLTLRIDPKDFDAEMEEFAGAFNDMISRLEKSFKHIEAFSYHVAHELKTPLTIIRGEAELVLMKERSPEEYKRGYKVTLIEVERILKTVEDLLLLTKLDYKPETLVFERFDVIEFLREVCDRAKLLASKKNIHFKCDLPSAKVDIKGTPLHLRRLFFNIIDNAVKFTPEGGRIDLTVTVHEREITVAIADTGPGIAPQHLPMIFDRFFRVDNNVAGQGLGLNIAQTVARLHQGRILVESRPGQGAVFKVVLPHL
ncbi:MAG: HAMP domain-containing protein [Candidatus Omnitrophica bacterium]|nr:HAMP domain-containing protein [Candidatus Omnitrophota bacterium]